MSRPRGSRRAGSMRRDTRAVSVPVGYALTLVVGALLLGVVITATTGLIGGQSQQVVDDELTVVGDQLAANVDEADGLAAAARDDADASGSDGRVVLEVDLPRRVSGTDYLVEIDDEDGDGGTITLEATNPSVVVEVDYPDTTLGVNNTDRFSGGPIELVYDGGDAIEVRP